MQTREVRGANSLLAALALLLLTLLFNSCGGAGATAMLADNPGASPVNIGAGTDSRLLPLGSPLPAIPAQTGDTGRAVSQAGQTLDFPGAVFLNAAGGTVDGDTLVLQSSATTPAWAMYKAGGLAGLKVDSFAVETVPGSLAAQYSVGLSNFSDGRWKFFITSSLPEVEVSLSHNTQRLVSHLGNLYWVVVVSGGESVRVVAGHVFTVAEHDGDWCPERGSGLTVSQGLADHIHIEWNKRWCAKHYELWGRLAPDQETRGASCWSDGQGNDWVLVADTDENSYDDYDVEASVWYEYKVRARNHCGHGGFSEVGRGYMGDVPGGNPADPCDSQGLITALDEGSLTLDNGAGYTLTPDTLWLLADGGGTGPQSFAVGDKVAVDGTAGEGMCLAVTVTMVEKGGVPTLFEAESIIAVRSGGVLQLQNGMSFVYDGNTEWLDLEGNPTTSDNFQPLTPVHVWGSILGQEPARALKVQLVPPIV